MTRSKSKIIQDSIVDIQLEVNIDFEDSSLQWRKNKRYIGNGAFKYLNEKIIRNTKKSQKCV